jgi:hypothetical protein
MRAAPWAAALVVGLHKYMHWLLALPQVERCVQGMSKEELQAKVHDTPTFQMLAGEAHVHCA